MAKFVLIYKGGSMGETPEEQQKGMEAWMNWFGTLGPAVVDGGAPFAASSTIASDGEVKNTGASDLSGYSIIDAGSMSDATSKAQGCPVLSGGGSVEVYEAQPMG